MKRREIPLFPLNAVLFPGSTLGLRIFEAILRHASGEPTKSESLGLGDNEFVPWHLGIVS